MSSPSQGHHDTIEVLLDICDELNLLRRTISEEGDIDCAAALTDKTNLTQRLLSVLSGGSSEICGMLSDPAAAIDLEERDIQLLAVLFHQRLVADEGFLTGRDLLWVLQESPADLLRETPRLSADGGLRKNKLLTVAAPEDVSEKDLLGQEFRIVDSAFLRLCAGEPFTEAEIDMPAAPASDAYGGVSDYLDDMEKLSRLAQQRSVVFFDEGLWHETVFRPGCSPAESRRRVREKQSQINKKLAASPSAQGNALDGVVQEYELSSNETLILSTLLFQECLRGVGSIAAIDLLRLVSSTPLDLVQNRSLLSHEGRLVSGGLIHVQTDGEDKPSTGQVAIANWVIARILTPRPVGAAPIQDNDIIEFHEFLDGLNCSSEFFERLE